MPRTLTPAQFARKLRERAADLQNGRASDSLREQVVAVIVSDALEGFSRSEDPDGRRWPAIKRPRRDGSTDKPLIATGALRAAVASLRAAGDAAGIRQVQARCPYAAFHMTGTRTMPARPFLGIGRRGQRRLDAAIREWANNWAAGFMGE